MKVVANVLMNINPSLKLYIFPHLILILIFYSYFRFGALGWCCRRWWRRSFRLGDRECVWRERLWPPGWLESRPEPTTDCQLCLQLVVAQLVRLELWLTVWVAGIRVIGLRVIECLWWQQHESAGTIQFHRAVTH